jgi:transposase-like protein
VDTQPHFCPNPRCNYYGWIGFSNIRANGHPSGGRWRQLQCVACGTYFLETHGTPLHGKRVAPELVVWAVGALAEGLGIRAVARVFAVDPNTVLAWLVEVADHATVFSQYFLHDVRVTQVQLDELFALLGAIKDGAVSEAEAIQRLSRAPHWVWVAIDPVTKLLLAIEVGERTLAMAQRVVHHVAGTRLCTALFDRRVQRVSDSLAHPLWAVGATRTPSGHRASSQTPLAAPAWAALCAGDQDGTPAALGAGEPAGGLRHAGGY